MYSAQEEESDLWEHERKHVRQGTRRVDRVIV